MNSHFRFLHQEAHVFSNMVVSNIVKGYYFRLKDKSTPLNLKLKLIKYAWYNESVVIANKVQVLLDCIGGLLINKRKNVLSDEEVGHVWGCLDWLLLSNKVKKNKETLVLKPSFSQVLTITMKKLTKEKITYESSVLGCCKSFVTSPVLSHLFIANIQNVVSLLSVVCTISIQQFHNTGRLDPSLQELLSVLCDAYKKAQRKNTNQKHVFNTFCDDLFVPCVNLMFLCKSHAEYEEVSSRLATIVNNTLLDKDQFVHYSSYLKVVCKMEQEVHMPKHIEKLFDHFKKSLATDDETRLAFIDFLPMFFSCYLQKQILNSESCQMMFLALNKQIGVVVEKGSFCGDLKESDLVNVLDSLLKHIHNFDIYDVGHDNSEDGMWLLYFKMLLNILLDIKRKTSSWYSCLETLVQLNPEITKDHLNLIFAVCWQSNTEFDSLELESVDSFLTTVFDTYHKLRKVPFLIEMMAKSIEDSSSDSCIRFPQKAYLKFQNIVQMLPPTVEIAIWKNLVTVIQDKMLKLIRSKDSDASRECAKIMTLLVHFLHHCVIIGPTVTSLNAKEFQELLVLMKKTILSPSVNYCIDLPSCDKILLEATLLLTHTWGELFLLMLQFPASEVHPIFSEPLEYRCFQSSTWEKISKQLDEKTLVANLLHLQRVKAGQMFPDLLSEKETAQVCNVDSILDSLILKDVVPLNITEKPFQFTQLFYQNGFHIKSQRELNWFLLTSNLPLLMPLFSQTQLLTVSQIILDTFQTGSGKSENQIETFLTLKLLNDSLFQEMKPLHSSLISSIFIKLSDLFVDKKSKSSKKQKVSSVDCSEIFIKLSDTKINRSKSQKKVAERLKNIGEDICSLLKSPPDSNKNGQNVQQNSALYVQVLQQLPVRFLSSNDQIRAIMGLQVLLACNPLTDVLKKADDPEKASCQPRGLPSVQCALLLMQKLLFSGGDNSVFQYVQPELFLDYLSTIFKEIKNEAGDCKKQLLISINQLLEAAFFSFVNEPNNLPDLQSYISKLCKNLHKSHKKLKKKLQEGETIDDKNSFTYLLATMLIEALGKKIRICHWKKNVKEEFISLLNQLSEAILEAQNYLSEELSPLDRAPLLAPNISVLTYQDFLPNLDKDAVNQLWKNMANISYENLFHKKDFPLLVLSIDFYLISLNQSLAAQFLTLEVRKNLWQRLHQLLYTFLSEEKTMPSQNDPNPMDPESQGAVDFVRQTYSKKVLTIEFEDDSQSSLKAQRKFLIGQIKLIMGNIILTSDNEDLHFYFEEMISDLTVEMALTDTVRLKSTVDILVYLFENQRIKEEEEHLPRFLNSQCNILRSSQTILQQIQWYTDLTKMETVVIPLLKLEAKILQKYKSTLPSQAALQVMLGCQYVRLNDLPLSTFCAVFHTLCDVLSSLMLDFERAVLATLPTFIGLIKKLIVAVCQEGKQDILTKKTEAVKPITDCAQYLSRLISLLSNHKINLSKIIGHFVADYLAAIQQSTLMPSIKGFLDSEFYTLLGICQEHDIKNLLVELPEGLRHVFRSLYNKYVQNHKYTGII